MAAPENAVTTAEFNVALDQEFVESFTNEFDRLAEIIGIFGRETIPAGTALYQLKITGQLNDAAGDSSSSGKAYKEGDLVALSKFSAKKEPIGAATVRPYRRMTTAAAILASGYVPAVLRTDAKMSTKCRGAIVGEFFEFLKEGTGTAEGTSLQATLANVNAALGDALEGNDDEADRVIHFVNREDAAEYLGKAPVTVQTVFGMTYIQNFLGVTDVFLTNKVDKGTVYATPVENIKIFGIDFGSLDASGLSYQVDASGLVGVAHTPAYDHVSAETNVLLGAKMFAEVKDYIVKGTIAPLV